MRGYYVLRVDGTEIGYHAHHQYASARAEAERLARHTGKPVDMFRSVARFTPLPVTVVETKHAMDRQNPRARNEKPTKEEAPF